MKISRRCLPTNGSSVDIREFSDGLVASVGDIGYQHSADVYQGTRVDEVLDRSLLAERSPWDSFVMGGSGNRCGSTDQFSDDGMVIIERESDGAIGNGTCQFNETGSMTWDTNATVLNRTE